jgi:hypothetical protein
MFKSFCNKILVAFFFISTLLGCNSTGISEELKYNVMPKELADCKIFRISGATGEAPAIVIARCPNSTTTTTSEVFKKSTATAIAIDGSTIK